jgi:hypothetical protein
MLIKKWQLACEEDIAHVVVLPNVTPTSKIEIDLFVEELCDMREDFGSIQPLHPDSPLSTKLAYCSSWEGSATWPLGFE